MLIALAEALLLADRCAPSVAAPTLMSIVRVESGFDPLAIGVNGSPRISVKAANTADAVRQASTLIAAGRSVDLGLAQINSKNLRWLGLSIEEAFDPCRNLAAAAQVLQSAYVRSDPGRLGPQSALLQALSYYNTGDPRRGFRNGYVARVTLATKVVTPSIPAIPVIPAMGAAPVLKPSWDVFGGSADPSGFVIRVTSPTAGGFQ